MVGWVFSSSRHPLRTHPDARSPGQAVCHEDSGVSESESHSCQASCETLTTILLVQDVPSHISFHETSQGRPKQTLWSHSPCKPLLRNLPCTRCLDGIPTSLLCALLRGATILGNCRLNWCLLRSRLRLRICTKKLR